jgi:hypothetical protein
MKDVTYIVRTLAYEKWVAEKRNMDKISYLRLSKSDVERKLAEHSQQIPE